MIDKDDKTKTVFPIEILSKIFKHLIYFNIDLIIPFRKYILLKDLKYILKDFTLTDLINLVKKKQYAIVNIYTNVFNPKCECCKRKNANFIMKFTTYDYCNRCSKHEYIGDNSYLCELNCHSIYPSLYKFTSDEWIVSAEYSTKDGCHDCGRTICAVIKADGVQLKELQRIKKMIQYENVKECKEKRDMFNNNIKNFIETCLLKNKNNNILKTDMITYYLQHNYYYINIKHITKELKKRLNNDGHYYIGYEFINKV